MNLTNISQLLLAATLMLNTSSTIALPEDSHSALDIQADKVDLDYGTGMYTFKGQAIATQGSTILTGDVITAIYDLSHNITEINAIGNEQQQASYQTLPKAKDVEFYAKANTINYSVEKSIATFAGHVIATHGQDKFTGEHVVYNIEQQNISTIGSKTSQSTVVINTK